MTADALLQSAITTHGCTTGTIHWLEEGSSVMTLIAHVGLPSHVADLVAKVPIGKGMAGLAAERREPVQTCNLQQDRTGDIRPGAKAVPVQASIAVPMVLDGALRGVLGIAKGEEHEWSEAEIAALSATAAEIARQLIAA